jgi:hypothetical protein
MDFNGIECFYTNADSLPNNLGELMTRIQDGKNSYEVIGITEIYPTNCRYLPGKAELQMEGYGLFLSESTSISKRGAAFFDTVVNSLLCSSRFSGLLLGLLYMQPSNNISLLFSLICAHTLSFKFHIELYFF